MTHRDAEIEVEETSEAVRGPGRIDPWSTLETRAAPRKRGRDCRFEAKDQRYGVSIEVGPCVSAFSALRYGAVTSRGCRYVCL